MKTVVNSYYDSVKLKTRVIALSDKKALLVYDRDEGSSYSIVNNIKDRINKLDNYNSRDV